MCICLKNPSSLSFGFQSIPNLPVGQIVARDSRSSEWMSLPGSSKQMASTVPEFNDPNPAWIEMPPGGWADGEFHDPSESRGEHAYAIYLKPEPNANVIRIVSETYHSLAN